VPGPIIERSPAHASVEEISKRPSTVAVRFAIVTTFAQTASGFGFMSHGAAINRLRKALVPMLASGQQAMAGPGLFEQVFSV
jgi:hypothetical protein